MAMSNDTPGTTTTDAPVSDIHEISPDALPTSPERPVPLIDDDQIQPLWNRPRHEWKVRLGLFAFLCLIFLPNLGSFGLWDPWETHYGTVTTNMVETQDWISPWWGYKEKIGTEARQGAPFYSKPVLIFWSEAFFSRLIGRGEWAIRLPMALLAIFAVLSLYLAVSKIWTRRAGLITAVVTATSPQFFMISRQAQTDMPFVATLVIALSMLMLAYFGPRQRLSARAFWAWIFGTLGFLLLATVPQYLVLISDLDAIPQGASSAEALEWLSRSVPWRLRGWIHALGYSTLLALVIGHFAWSIRRDIKRDGLSEAVTDKWVRRCLVILFYVMAAESTYAKGLLGFMLPGAIIFVYLLVSHSWRSLGRVELIRGPLIFICVGFPWYIAMFAKHGMAYYQRFFIHDHFNRLGAGVHQIDSGTFEHFIKWLGVGLFPWAIFVPFALAAMLRQNPRDGRPQGQAKLFVSLWFFFAFIFFTMSSTKFHHYIFPAMPALAVLVGLFLDKLIDDNSWVPRVVTLVAIGFFAVIAWDLHEDPQHLRNLMTYKYDRPLAEHLPIDVAAPVSKGSDTVWGDSVFWRHTTPTLQSILTTEAFQYHRWITAMAVLGLISLLFFGITRTRRIGLAGLAVMASLMSMWSLSYYMPTLSPHWSQKYLFDSYYDTCTIVPNSDEVEAAYTPLLSQIGLDSVARSLGHTSKMVCEEDVISWLITWRGETYYSFNELQPIGKEKPQFMPYLEERNGGEKFYVLMERGKSSSFHSKLKTYSDKLKRQKQPGWEGIESWDVQIECDESLYFQMISATPVRTKPL